jgi:hypothetical protein
MSSLNPTDGGTPPGDHHDGARPPGGDSGIGVGGLALAAIVVLVLIVAGLVTSRGGDGGMTTASTSTTHTVVYRVEGSSVGEAAGWTADMTYSTDGSGSVTQETGATVPWIRSFTWAAGGGLIAQVSAQNNYSDEITCSIEVDGVQVKSVTASGEYAIASCVATVK